MNVSCDYFQSFFISNFTFLMRLKCLVFRILKMLDLLYLFYFCLRVQNVVIFAKINITISGIMMFIVVMVHTRTDPVNILLIAIFTRDVI